MNRIYFVAMLSFLVCVLSLNWNCFPAKALAEETTQVIKIAHRDQNALIKTVAGELRVVHVGDAVKSFGTIQSIYPDRIVFKNSNFETIVLFSVNGEQHLQRISKINPSPQRSIVKIVTSNGQDAGAGQLPHDNQRTGDSKK